MNNDFDRKLLEKYISKEALPEALKKLESGYPVQYIIGNVEFYNLTINVNENVLIPRFETEYLVDDLIKYINENGFVKPKIIDMGTGSGCIAIAIKKNIDSYVTGIDISDKAIKVAKENAKINNVSISFKCIDLCKYTSDGMFDIIVSNPPYVPFDSEVDEKIKYEPQNAIFAEDNGLFFYKKILDLSTKILNKKNIIAFEIGNNEADDISKYAKKYYPHSKIIVKKDLNNFKRYVYIINN